MNTVKSVGYGWGVLIVAGAGSYYFAKRSINADRAERAATEEKRRQTQYRLRAQETVSRDMAMTGQGSSSSKRKVAGESSPDADHPSPSREAGTDIAPVGHAQDGALPKSKYEASEPFRSRKGDRFS